MITIAIALCPRGEVQERVVNQAMEAVEKIEGVVKGKKLFGGESIGYLVISLGWMSYWLPVRPGPGPGQEGHLPRAPICAGPIYDTNII